jgi:hypothetical protein
VNDVHASISRAAPISMLRLSLDTGVAVTASVPSAPPLWLSTVSM